MKSSQRWLLFLLFLPLSGVLCFSELSFITEPSDVTALPKDPVTLDCQAHGQPPVTIKWLKNGLKLAESEHFKFLPNGSLYIPKIKHTKEDSDEGFYQCLSQNKYGAILSQRSRLTIARITEFESHPVSMVMSEGSVARFSCAVTSSPPATITWEFNQSTLPLQTDRITVLPNGVLQIHNIQLEDAGKYRCVATNIGSLLKSREATLTVHKVIPFYWCVSVSVPPTIVERPESQTRPRAGTARFMCQAEGVPPPRIRWLKNGEDVHLNGRIKMYNGKLVITQIIPEDDAIYQCMAENEQGSVLSLARLIVVMSEDRPSAPRNIHAETISSSAILLAWERPLYNADKVIAYSIHYMKAEGETEMKLVLEREQLKMHNQVCLLLVPPAPVLQLEALNCTSLRARWQTPPDSVAVLGFRLCYHEEGQPEQPSILLQAHTYAYTIGGLDPRRKYHVKILAISKVGDGYQTDQTLSTPGCVSARDQLAVAPPPPHQVTVLISNSSAVSLRWSRPAFSSGKPVSYTVRCTPVGTHNVSAIRYIQTTKQSVMVRDLHPNTQYEFVVRLHVDEMSSSWSSVVYHQTAPAAPSHPPAGVRVTLIEDDTALVSWREPSEPHLVVTHYTILYASQQAWMAGHWQRIQREGTHTMALLEKLEPGKVYLLKICASNKVGDGPFSNTVELAPRRGHRSKNPRHSDSFPDSKVFSDGLYHLDQSSMTGIMVGVSIALTCIAMCALILISKGRPRKSASPKMVAVRGSGGPHPGMALPGSYHLENVEALLPMISSRFIDPKGGSDLIMNSSGSSQVQSNKWLIFQKEMNDSAASEAETRVCLYEKGRTVLRYDERLGSAPLAPSSREIIYGPLHSESSQSSEGSQETGDSGHFSNEESNEEFSNSSTCQTSGSLESDDGPNLKQSVKLEPAAASFHPTEGSWLSSTS
ncbi:PREDICTED: protogenin-like [Cyprinodon variegatus]|uniref:protogenin-like n=1 Tax=Cyprinodon variegatus TaxID=28743 RepID=UPI0007425F4B|nr:PREDICTED: protogenin-like [Cyprinodon variegatus]